MKLTHIDSQGRKVWEKEATEVKPYAKAVQSIFYFGGHVVTESGEIIKGWRELAKRKQELNN